VVDTGYWVELFQIPKQSSKEKYKQVKAKFAQAFEQKASLYWPLPCVYELANHIAHVRDGNLRKQLADKLYRTIFDVEKNPSIVVTPACAVDELKIFLEKFSNTYVSEGFGLADAAVIDEAKRLKNKNNRVHIWTLESTIKAREPDTESSPFVG
jgi:hypothetical protein